MTLVRRHILTSLAMALPAAALVYFVVQALAARDAVVQLERVATARGLMSNGTGAAERSQLLHRAVAIIDELRNSLNFKAGGEVSHNLDALYEYMCTRLMQASAQNKPEWLDEVSRLLGEIRGAWLQIAQANRQQAANYP
jgi:flagellar protein FliS